MILLSLLGNFFALFVPTLFISAQIQGSTSDPRVTGWIAMFPFNAGYGIYPSRFWDAYRETMPKPST
jgi:hypothetical protein